MKAFVAAAVVAPLLIVFVLWAFFGIPPLADRPTVQGLTAAVQHLERRLDEGLAKASLRDLALVEQLIRSLDAFEAGSAQSTMNQERLRQVEDALQGLRYEMQALHGSGTQASRTSPGSPHSESWNEMTPGGSATAQSTSPAPAGRTPAGDTRQASRTEIQPTPESPGGSQEQVAPAASQTAGELPARTAPGPGGGPFRDGDGTAAAADTSDSSMGSSAALLHLSPATVRRIQQALNQAGFNAGHASGSWNIETQDSVRTFQQAEGLEPTGTLNRETLAALDMDIEAILATEAGAESESGGVQADAGAFEQEQAQGVGAVLYVSPADLRRIRKALNEAGFDAGAVTGLWDAEIEETSRTFQQAKGLEPTGRLNLRTLGALDSLADNLGNAAELQLEQPLIAVHFCAARVDVHLHAGYGAGVLA